MLAGVALAAAWVWWFGLPGRGVVVVLRPIDAATALLVRGVGRDAALFRVDARGRPLWRARVPSFVDPFAPYGGLLLGGGLVAYGEQVGNDGTIHARALADGHEVWESEARWYDAHEHVVDRRILGAVTPGAFVFAGGGSPVRFTGFDVRDGRTLWRRDVFGAPSHLWTRGGFVVIGGGMNGESYRLDTHEHSHLRAVATDLPCVTDDKVVYQSFDRLTADTFIGGNTVGRQMSDEHVWLAGPCGERGGHVITLANGIDRAVLAAWNADLTPAWRIEARGLRPARVSPGAYADLHPLAHRPPRFVPLLLATRATGTLQVVMFDLDERIEVWRSPEAAELAGFAIFRVGERYYLLDKTRVAVLDGTTGELRAAARVSGALPIQPYHLAGGKLWIATTGGDVGTLDGGTLAPDAQVPGVVVNDDRPAFAALLGRPDEEEE